jgi:hypothetical protein
LVAALFSARGLVLAPGAIGTVSMGVGSKERPVLLVIHSVAVFLEEVTDLYEFIAVSLGEVLRIEAEC